jgi:hypothetical protein
VVHAFRVADPFADAPERNPWFGAVDRSCEHNPAAHAAAQPVADADPSSIH